MAPSDGKPIRIILVDDHPLVRDGLRTGLNASPDFEVIGEASSGQEGLALAERTEPDVALVDISLRDREFGGIRLTARLRDIYPGIKVIILTMHEDREYVISAMRAGAQGYVLKDAGLSEIIGAIQAVAKGGCFYSTSAARLLLHESPIDQGLTQREHEVLILLAKGHSNKRIAQELGIGIRTVESHRLNLRRKLGIDTLAGLVKYALDKGWIKDSISHDLGSSLLDNLGLAAALGQLANDFSAQTGVAVDVHVSECPVVLPRSPAITLFQIAQEALTNVAKHAHATQVTLRLKADGQNVSLAVIDNGKGFDIHKTLQSLRERAELEGGSMQITARPGCTELLVTLPLTV